MPAARRTRAPRKPDVMVKIKAARKMRSDTLEEALRKREQEVEKAWGEEMIRQGFPHTPLRADWKPWEIRRPSEFHASMIKTSVEELSGSHLVPAVPLYSAEKKEVLFHRDSRFLVVYSKVAASGRPIWSNFIGFAMFRFERLNDVDVLRCYEIQVEKKYQGAQVGRRMMLMLHYIARGCAMDKVVVNIPKDNGQARNFFTKHARFVVDESSPPASQGEDYETFSKVVPKKVTKMEIDEALEDLTFRRLESIFIDYGERNNP